MVFVRMLSKLLRDKEIGKLVVPIVPDEARTFGMESLFRAVGIYSHVGQMYEPVDMDTLLYYKEAKDGQILEEGITEAGSMSSFIAAGTAYATHGVNTIPFFIYYSMFGFQRVGDLIWAAADSRARGFLLGGTAGRTTLAGEGLQHQDGHSHVSRCACPNCVSYDPAYAYELAVIIQDGIRRMYEEQESIFYYLTVMNEQYAMPAMPEGARDGILKGMYRFKPADEPEGQAQGAAARQRRDPERGARGAEAAREVRRRRRRLERDQLPASSIATATPASAGTCCIPAETPKVPYVTQCLKDAPGVIRRRVRLPEGAAGLDRPLDAAPDARARHRRLRPQRRPRVAARVLRSRRAVRRRSRRWPSSRDDGQIDARSWRRPSRISEIDPEKARPAPSASDSHHTTTDANRIQAPRTRREHRRRRRRPRAGQGRATRSPKDQPVLELETDKATIEVPSSVGGTVSEVKVKPGDKVKVGQVVLTVDDGAGAGRRRRGAAKKDADSQEPRLEPRRTATRRRRRGRQGRRRRRREEPARGRAGSLRKPPRPRTRARPKTGPKTRNTRTTAARGRPPRRRG